MTVKLVEGQGHRVETLAMELDTSDIWTIVDQQVEVQHQAVTIKCRAIAEMLTERCILQDVKQSQRALYGAKQLMAKYALCRNLWAEILLKLAAVALVTVVQALQGTVAMKLCMGITLATAAIIFLAQPYLQPQINTLQCFCFSCLSLASFGFALGLVWLSRMALVMPFVLAAWQCMSPDSSQSLAVRLWKKVEAQLSKLEKGEEIEVIAETYSLR